jgi:peptidoglycan/LPS O-acetylase OafA/YrhL
MTQALSRRQGSYRSDIDGLRAIAVLLVIFYHLGAVFLPTGYVGVDIFFVISGFLITQNIMKEIAIGRFSFKGFYLKRMRRIYPALLCVLGFTTLAALFVMVAGTRQLLTYFHTLISALLGASNLFLKYYLHANYFKQSAGGYMPLMHTWSLGVEEQFYLFWPLFLWLVCSKLSTLKQSITIIIIASASLYVFVHNVHGVYDYYNPIPRAYELMIGAFLTINRAWIEKIGAFNRYINDVLSLIGFALIVCSSFALIYTGLVGFNTFLACIGSAIVICSGFNEGLVNKLLAIKPLVFTGLISYSLYLWHWPIIYFLEVSAVNIDFLTGLGILVLTFILSYLTWLLVEQRFRFQWKFGFLKTIICFIIIPVVLVSVLVLMIRQHPQWGYNSVLSNRVKIISGNYYGPYKGKKCIDSPLLLPAAPNACAFGALKSKHYSAVLVGDSHAMAYAGMLNVLFKNAGLKGYIITKSGVPFLLPSASEQHLEHPVQRSDVLENIIRKHHYKYVIVSAFWNYYEDAAGLGHFERVANGLRRSVKFILASGSVPVVMTDFPPLLYLSKYCGYTTLTRARHCYNSQARIRQLQGGARRVIYSLKRQYPQMIVIDPISIICPHGRCLTSIKGTPLYFDGSGVNTHLNYTGSTLIGDLYLKKYTNPFLHH